MVFMSPPQLLQAKDDQSAILQRKDSDKDSGRDSNGDSDETRMENGMREATSRVTISDDGT